MTAHTELRPADAAAFEQHRAVLLGVAYRMLGSWWDAEDVLQDAWLRWHGADRAAIDDPRRWLVTVTTRLALDQLRSARHRRETYPGTWLPEPIPVGTQVGDPAETARQRDMLSLAALRLMEQLTPPERGVYLLRETFELPYAEIADVLGLTETNARQLHRRAADRIGDDRERFSVDNARHRDLVDRFMNAAATGDRAALQALLAVEVTLWSDGGGKARAALNPVVGPSRVARFLTGVAAKSPDVEWWFLEVNGGPAALVRLGARWSLMTWETDRGRLVAIQLLANPDKLRALGLFADEHSPAAVARAAWRRL
ncbi:RNA polymerase sigma24 factor [Catellatospora methionotrophica]|uniref:RNA polymerase sigma24 factor n=1 Tax=Catellatospora methionotrophica TaxID=121620 RepID=A0A8J3LC18_9ACTN|nr:RNA polymerase sigma factor SigJ [Catellatospora methionotrophica]GIG12261.1 RNA polymerase sigma24 factor [Catellatospora methionotrophica]